MSAQSVKTTCPCCFHTFWADLEEETSFWGELIVDPYGEQQCPLCEWVFQVDDFGIVVEGTLDKDNEVSFEEGELCPSTMGITHCPRCQEPQEIEAREVCHCPNCPAQFLPEEGASLESEEEWEDLPPTCYPEWEETGAYDPYYHVELDHILCPACETEIWYEENDLDSRDEHIPLGNGWILCRATGAVVCREHSETLLEKPKPKRRARCVVAEDGSGDYLSLSEALWEVGPDVTLIVRPGHYGGIIAIGCNLKIVGEGDPEEIHLGNIRLIGGTTTVRDASLTSVVVEHGRARFQNCRIRNGSGIGAAVTGWRSRARFKECEISQCRAVGISCTHFGTVRMSDCVVAGNGNHGLLLTTGGWAGLSSCRLANNKGNAIACKSEESTVLLWRCHLMRNGNAGLHLESGQSVLSNCVVEDHAVGIDLGDRSRIILLKCRLRRNQQQNLAGQKERSCYTRGCDFFPDECEPFGSSFQEDGSPAVLRFHA